MKDNIKHKKITVVCGGISSEREISLRSGKAVYMELINAGFTEVALFDLTNDNLGELLASKPDVCFIALHGRGGEDGCIQGALELAGIPYTGSGVAASANSMNKILTKQLMSYYGIPTAKFLTFRRAELCISDTVEILVRKIGLPMVLKSPCEGSSIGVVIVRRREDIAAAVAEVFSHGETLLAEEYLDGTEITLPVLGNGEPVALPLIEITSENEFYDFTAKYTPGMCHHIIPARIVDAEREAINEIGKRAYSVIGCRGFARIDFIVDREKGPMVIEINTIPGMTEMSLFPDSARAAGISFEKLITKILELSLE